ncbi:hypothetical protein WOLCODRAFT_140516 [Wolfiporia cocos MD-104 SS10]|uniref:Uncharacterized protein n=1 Tax=Wolfiporia cocos (strain MD-104) TaxID=742152 RepID=A0A2H3JIT8_WOLCO|nr:hypothetical protein WOLCODRAFT_140516 [Wolfiporia cocos MD-104 SS10]
MRAFDVIEHPSFESEASRRDYLTLLGITSVVTAIASTAVAMRVRGTPLSSFVDAFAQSH